MSQNVSISLSYVCGVELHGFFRTRRTLNASQLLNLVEAAICSDISDTTGCVGLTGRAPCGVREIFMDDFK